MTIELPPISYQIWDMKYRFKAPDGTPIDQTIRDTWWRVANALAKAENQEAPELFHKGLLFKPQDAWAARFYEAMTDFKFIPAGRILAGAGTDRDVTLQNCFVMGTIPDSLDGIFSHLREAALTMQQGGGIGYDFSTLRPKGSPVKGVSADASGPLSFMDVWDAMCRTIMSAGTRRGAMMACMRCDHPNIFEFIEAKRTVGRLNMFNMSVLVTDAFMEAVKKNDPWFFEFNGHRHGATDARKLWDAIMHSTYNHAEPGVIFIDRVNKLNNLWYCEQIAATNPCGEEPLPPYGSCDLGSINLASLVKKPFTKEAHLDHEELEQLVPLAVRMLDNVYDVTKFPLPQQREEALSKRRLGLGVTGLGNALAMCGLRYGSDKAVDAVTHWISAIQNHAYLTSTDLAFEKGTFPLYNRDGFINGEHVKTLPTHVLGEIVKKGMRNSHLMAVAPTGTISLFAGNVSGGIEPPFALTYTRKVLQKDGTRTEETVQDYAYALARHETSKLSSVFDPRRNAFQFATAQDLTPDDHLQMLAAVQSKCDTSISKTVNLPTGISFEDFKDVYLKAYNLGCKSCTTYRPNDVVGSVLSVEELDELLTNPPEPNEVLTEPSVFETDPLDEIEESDLLPIRPETLTGHTYKLRWPDGVKNHAYYITINDNVESIAPFEIFINSKDVDHQAWTTALTRMVSAIFRRGGNVDFVVEELKAIHDPKGGAWIDKRYVPSLQAAIGNVIEKYLERTTVALPVPRAIRNAELNFPFSCPDLDQEESKPTAAYIEAVNHSLKHWTQCPKCGAFAISHQGGCETCLDCHWSRCE